MQRSTPAEPHRHHQSKIAAASGWIGSALEYYDFLIYATAASLVFPQLFFPSGNPTVAIIASLATFGVGYVARPLGAMVLGHIGDRHGRKTVLIFCMFLMGFSTMCVGLLPTYQQVGIWAPVMLVILRLVQGFAVAGELSGASSMILEHAPFGRRGYFTSFTIQGSQAGQLLAFGVFLPLAHFIPKDQFASWGWRIPFLFSVVVIIVGYVIRRQVRETPTFAQERAHGEVPASPVAEVLRQNWGENFRFQGRTRQRPRSTSSLWDFRDQGRPCSRMCWPLIRTSSPLRKETALNPRPRPISPLLRASNGLPGSDPPRL